MERHPTAGTPASTTRADIDAAYNNALKRETRGESLTEALNDELATAQAAADAQIRKIAQAACRQDATPYTVQPLMTRGEIQAYARHIRETIQYALAMMPPTAHAQLSDELSALSEIAELAESAISMFETEDER